MSEHRNPPQAQGASLEPRIISWDPRIINRSPERPIAVTPVAPRASSETRKPKSLRLFSLYNPFSGHRRNTIIVSERSSRHRRNQSEGESPSPATSSPRGRPSSRPSPPIIVQRTTQSNPPTSRTIDMPPSQSHREYIPLPPILPREIKEVQHEEKRDSGRESRQSQTTEEIIRPVEEPRLPRTASRRHRRYPSQASNPLSEQETVLPTAPRARPLSENYSVVTTPNAPVRSRPVDGDVRNSREYLEMKAAAEHNQRAAEEYARRSSSAEVRLQNLTRQLAESTSRENELRHELEKTRARLELCRCKGKDRSSSRENELKAELAAAQLENERQKRLELERDRDHERELARSRTEGRQGESHRESSSGGGRRRRIRVHKVHQEDDSRPRTVDPRASSAVTAAPVNAGMAAIEQARADAARQEKVRR